MLKRIGLTFLRSSILIQDGLTMISRLANSNINVNGGRIFKISQLY